MVMVGPPSGGKSMLTKKGGAHSPAQVLPETGARRVTAIELIELGEALGFDPAAAVRRVAKMPK
jgi:hypothetical protein